MVGVGAQEEHQGKDKQDFEARSQFLPLGWLLDAFLFGQANISTHAPSSSGKQSPCAQGPLHVFLLISALPLSQTVPWLFTFHFLHLKIKSVYLQDDHIIKVKNQSMYLVGGELLSMG